MRKKLIVCSACGKIKGEHSFWDVSCELHQVEVWADTIVRGSDTRVVKAEAVSAEAVPEDDDDRQRS